MITPRLVLLIGVCVPLLVLSQASCAAADELAQRADAAYQAGDWSEARTLYAEMVAGNAGSGRGWYRLAVARRHLGDTDGALAALDRAAAAGVPVSFTGFERAKVHAGVGDTDAALAALGAAVAAGFAQPESLEGNPEFEALLGTPEFDALVAQAHAARYPCHGDDSPFRHFDFWVGSWEVHDAAGNRQGSNEIRLRENGCFLEEQWTSAGGTTGSSINYYDTLQKAWVQQWIDASGTQIKIAGGLSDGSMVLNGKISYLRTGQIADFRARWTPLEDGRVRQFFEQSTDGGENWTPWFEGFYRRVGD